MLRTVHAFLILLAFGSASWLSADTPPYEIKCKKEKEKLTIQGEHYWDRIETVYGYIHSKDDIQDREDGGFKVTYQQIVFEYAEVNNPECSYEYLVVEYPEETLESRVEVPKRMKTNAFRLRTTRREMIKGCGKLSDFQRYEDKEDFKNDIKKRFVGARSDGKKIYRDWPNKVSHESCILFEL